MLKNFTASTWARLQNVQISSKFMSKAYEIKLRNNLGTTA